jgi:hypothetical protein
VVCNLLYAFIPPERDVKHSKITTHDVILALGEQMAINNISSKLRNLSHATAPVQSNVISARKNPFSPSEFQNWSEMAVIEEIEIGGVVQCGFLQVPEAKER